MMADDRNSHYLLFPKLSKEVSDLESLVEAKVCP